MTSIIVVAIVYAVVNLLAWLVEFLAAVGEWMLLKAFSKPERFRKIYVRDRVIATKILLHLSFGMLGPRKITQLTKIRASLKPRRKSKKFHFKI